jgi:repressor LexA
MNDQPGTTPGRKPIHGLSPTLEKTLGVIGDFILNKGMAPSIYDLADILGISAPSAHTHVVKLEEKGFIRRTKGVSRSIEILRGPSHIAHQATVAVIGRVAAGEPILAVENIIGEISVSSDIVRGHCFALEVVGDSMIDAGIHEGDYLIVRQQPIAENGDIVIAMLNGDEATVKRLSILDDRIELRPANPEYKPIQVGHQDNLVIVGKVLAVSSKKNTKKY